MIKQKKQNWRQENDICSNGFVNNAERIKRIQKIQQLFKIEH